MKATFQGFAVIRRAHDSHNEFIDLESISGAIDYTKQKAREFSDRVPDWAHANPIRRLSRITITEMEA